MRFDSNHGILVAKQVYLLNVETRKILYKDVAKNAISALTLSLLSVFVVATQTEFYYFPMMTLIIFALIGIIASLWKNIVDLRTVNHEIDAYTKSRFYRSES